MKISKKTFTDFIINSLCPNCLITIQMPYTHKTKNFERFRSYVRVVMKKVEKDLLGKKWNKFHYRFIVFYENCNNLTTWHAHIICNFKNEHTGISETFDNIENACAQANHAFRTDYSSKKDLEIHVSMLENIDQTEKAINYCQKELWHECLDKSSVIRMEFSDDIFSLKKHSAQSGAL